MRSTRDPARSRWTARFGDGGHARLVAERIGPGGTLVCIDRDPRAEQRFDELAAEAPCEVRFVGLDFALGLEELAAEGFEADLVYLDLGRLLRRSSTTPRAGSPTPSTRGSTCAWTRARSSTRGTWSTNGTSGAWRRSSAPSARSATRSGSPARSSSAGASASIDTTHELVEAVLAAIPVPARFAAGHPARRVFQAIRIAVNDELDSLDRALPAAWSLLGPGGRLGAISFHSLEDRRVKRFLADRARGCICPPDLPVCACGKTPEAELLAAGGVTPSAGEVAANPRARSSRLRAARRLAPGGRCEPARCLRRRGGPSALAPARQAGASPRPASPPAPRPRRPPAGRPRPPAAPRPPRPADPRPRGAGPPRPAPRGRRPAAPPPPAARRLARPLNSPPVVPRPSSSSACCAATAWSCCVGLLLAGVVFLNVRLLELDGTIARDAAQVSSLRQENGALRLRAARLGSSERIQQAAAQRGFVWPAPGAVRHVRPGRRDAAMAARRMIAPNGQGTGALAAGNTPTPAGASAATPTGANPAATPTATAPTTAAAPTATAPTGATQTPAAASTSAATPASSTEPSTGAAAE